MTETGCARTAEDGVRMRSPANRPSARCGAVRSGILGRMELEGRRVLITGASRGIGGAALAEEFAGADARLAVLARESEALRDRTSKLNASLYAVDLSDPVDHPSRW